MPKTEKFKCMNEKCGFEFKTNRGHATCGACGSVYVEWVNFRDDWELNEDNEWVRMPWFEEVPVVDKNTKK